MPKQAETVDQFLKWLEHPLKSEIEEVRAVILGADHQITEHIKWNAPSFRFGGDDRITFKLRPADRIQLVFHRGAKAKNTAGFVFEDHTDLIDWVAPDRGVVTFADMSEMKAHQEALRQLVVRWVNSTT